MRSLLLINMANILDKLASEVDNLEDSGQENSSFDGSEKIGKNAQNDEETTGVMQTLLEEQEFSFPSVSDVIEGEVIEINSNAIYLDIPPFGTGVVLGREIKDGMGTHKLKLGDKVTATIIDLENDEGYIELSIREASYEKAWDDIESKRDTQDKIKTRILGANKGGLLVEVNGISGFLPVSQLSSRNYPRVEDGDKNKILSLLKKLVNQELEVCVIDADRESEKLIVSEKAAQKDRDKKIISDLKPGDTVEGEISGVVDFGAFVKFYPPLKDTTKLSEEDRLEGLVHISELAWQLIENPRDIVRVGNKVKAKIIGIDEDKISLSIRALEQDPWSIVEDKYKAGDTVEGTVHKINHFGAFVYLDKDIHGLAHVSELSELYPGKNIDELLKAGEKYTWKILSIEPRDHRMGLILLDKGKKPAKDNKSSKKESKKEDQEK